MSPHEINEIVNKDLLYKSISKGKRREEEENSPGRASPVTNWNSFVLAGSSSYS